MEAIILAGGLGTRLKHIVSNVPKPMAPINGKPFLEYVLDDLETKGINHVIMAVCHMKDVIINHFGNEYKGIFIDYSIETNPLLTGGAIKQATNFCKEESFFVINGDTFFDVDLQAIIQQHIHDENDVTIAVKRMKDFDRYGCVVIKDRKIIAFKEKQFCQYGYINGGIYYINKKTIKSIEKKTFSFENDFMEKQCKYLKIGACIDSGYFIDIGIAADYYRAQKEF
jgi:D-glycero-alpha-D-manno-heptose 1-phosphate guanylyltransferase